MLFDVTDAEGIARAAAQVSQAQQGFTLAGLVNSAGVAVSGPLLHQAPADFARHFDVNMLGTFRVTQAFASLLGAANCAPSGPPGRIVIVSSISGQLATPFLGAYAASKHAIEGYADALRCELMPYGIDVVVVGPGAVATPIWDKAEAESNEDYASTPYKQSFRSFRRVMIDNGRKGLLPAAVADVIFGALTVKRPKVRYAVVRGSLLNWVLPRCLPKRRLDELIASQMHLAIN